MGLRLRFCIRTPPVRFTTIINIYLYPSLLLSTLISLIYIKFLLNPARFVHFRGIGLEKRKRRNRAKPIQLRITTFPTECSPPHRPKIFPYIVYLLRLATFSVYPFFASANNLQTFIFRLPNACVRNLVTNAHISTRTLRSTIFQPLSSYSPISSEFKIASFLDESKITVKALILDMLKLDPSSRPSASALSKSFNQHHQMIQATYKPLVNKHSVIVETAITGQGAADSATNSDQASNIRRVLYAVVNRDNTRMVTGTVDDDRTTFCFKL